MQLSRQRYVELPTSTQVEPPGHALNVQSRVQYPPGNPSALVKQMPPLPQLASVVHVPPMPDVGVEQTPPEHVPPPVHMRPQPPQLFASVLVFTHAPPHAV